jgi:endonuclease-3 related protein
MFLKKNRRSGVMKHRKKLMKIYGRLHERFGSRKWWPARTAFEVMVGAILTQNTAWTNVEKAIANLKKEKMLSVKKMHRVRRTALEGLIRPSGFYKEKAKKLKAFVKFLTEKYKGSIKNMLPAETTVLRAELLDVKGVGPETADSILLYALGKPVFVVDAYTKRIFSRHKFFSADADYARVHDFFMRNLPKDVKLFNEYHALIVETGKKFCKKTAPHCKTCPLYGIL